MTQQTRVTKTLVAHLKREAKRRSRIERRTHSALLEQLAGEHGYASWSLLVAALPDDSPAQIRRNLAAADRLYDARLDFSVPIDPVLPADFDSTPNERRSPEQIKQWWDRPFARRLPDGRLDVRCLDGGAWDRSTWYGTAGTHEEARAIARQKLTEWLRLRRREIHTMDEDGRMWLARMPRRMGAESVTYIERVDMPGREEPGRR